MHDSLEVLLAQLQAATRRGCRASRLIYQTALLDALVPPDGASDVTFSGRMDRSYKAEALIIASCDSFESPAVDALKALFGLSGDHAAPLYRRRRVAGAYYDVRPRTFTKNYEDDLIMDLAAELWRRMGEH